jgi:phosphatidylethanolamine N-methyltransferase
MRCTGLSFFIIATDNSVSKPSSLDLASVRTCLINIVPLCLDSDPSLVPLSCGGTHDSSPDTEGDSVAGARDPDDFSFWSERQAKRICTAIEQAFDVEYAPEVIMADANLTRLANRILVSKQLLVA